MKMCMARPHRPNALIFCELPAAHDGIHQSMAHEWDLDGTGYRDVDRTLRRKTVGEIDQARVPRASKVTQGFTDETQIPADVTSAFYEEVRENPSGMLLFIANWAYGKGREDETLARLEEA